MVLLDTNVCIHILNEDDREIRTRFIQVGPKGIALCSVVKAELYAGARRSTRVSYNLERLERFFAPFQSLFFDDSAAEQYGLIQADLLRQGIPIGPNDLKIVSIARAYDCTLVTNNTREFMRVPGLRLTDWQAGA